MPTAGCFSSLETTFVGPGDLNGRYIYINNKIQNIKINQIINLQLQKLNKKIPRFQAHVKI